jgi:hypothetical protein
MATRVAVTAGIAADPLGKRDDDEVHEFEARRDPWVQLTLHD